MITELDNLRLDLLKIAKDTDINYYSVNSLIDDADKLYEYVLFGKQKEVAKCCYPEKDLVGCGYLDKEYDDYKDEVVSEKENTCEVVEAKIEPWNTDEFKKEYNDIQKIGEALFNTPEVVGEERTVDNLYRWLNKSEELKEAERKVLYDMYDAASKRTVNSNIIINGEDIPVRSVPIIKRSELKEIVKYNNSPIPLVDPAFISSEETRELWVKYKKATEKLLNSYKLTPAEIVNNLRDVQALIVKIKNPATTENGEENTFDNYRGKYDQIAKISRKWDKARTKKEQNYGEQLEAHCQKDPLYKLYSEQWDNRYQPKPKFSYFDQWSKERDEKLGKEKISKLLVSFEGKYFDDNLSPGDIPCPLH